MTTNDVISPMRIADIAEGVGDLINRRGWCQTGLLFDPQTMNMSMRGALALTLKLPPLSEVLFSPLFATDPRRREFAVVEAAFAAHMGLPDAPPCNCGGQHDDRMIQWEGEPGRTQFEVVHALYGLARAQLQVAAADLDLTDAVDWDALLRPAE